MNNPTINILIEVLPTGKVVDGLSLYELGSDIITGFHTVPVKYCASIYLRVADSQHRLHDMFTDSWGRCFVLTQGIIRPAWELSNE